MKTVDTAVGPEVEQYELALEIFFLQRLGVEPLGIARKFRDRQTSGKGVVPILVLQGDRGGFPEHLLAQDRWLPSRFLLGRVVAVTWILLALATDQVHGQ